MGTRLIVLVELERRHPSHELPALEERIAAALRHSTAAEALSEALGEEVQMWLASPEELA